MWLGRRSLVALDPVRHWIVIGCRVVVLVLLVGILSGLQSVRKHTDLTVFAALDQSESVRRFGHVPRIGDPTLSRSVAQWQLDYLSRAGFNQYPNDRFGLVTYDRRPTVRVPPQLGMKLDFGTVTVPMEGTDTAQMIRTVIAMYPPDSGTRLLISSDFNDTAGDTLVAAHEAAAAGIQIDVLPIHYRVNSEVLVEGLHAPIEAREGQTISLRAVFRATHPSTGLVQLLHNDVVQDLNGPALGTGTPILETDWTLLPEFLEPTISSADSPLADRYVTVKQIDVPMTSSGPNRLEVVFEPDDTADVESTNNRAEAFTLVSGKGRVLFVDGVGEDSGTILPHALRGRGIEIDVISPEAFPGQMSGLGRYDAVIFQNISAERITIAQQEMLVQYVHDLGGGFIMIGGPESFGAGAWTNTDLDRYILPVSCRIPSQTILPTGALVLVLDRSGSMAAPVMGSNKTQMEIASEAAILALSTLYPEDLVGVVAFDSSAKLIVDVQINSDPIGVAKLVRSIQPDGGTEIFGGLDLAYRKLAPIAAEEAAIKHIILLTDGKSRPGNYIKLLGHMNKAGISLSTIGIGDGHDGAELRRLAQIGSGTYHPVQDPNSLPQVFIKEAKMIRKNLIREVPFEPTLISTGSPILANIRSVPMLKGLVLTGAKPDSRIFMPIVGSEGEPVFAHWQAGLGRAAAFTSDATNRWAAHWLRWDGYADFWARATRAMARPSMSRDMDLATTIEGDQLMVRLDVASLDGLMPGAEWENFLRVEGSILRPDGQTMRIGLDQVGPGVYEAHAPADVPGSYIVSLYVQSPQGGRKVVFGGANRTPGQELRQLRSNLAMMTRVTEITGGRLLDPYADHAPGLFDRTEPVQSFSVQPLWRMLLAWLIVVFLLDVACRRIAWDLVGILNWLRSRLAVVAGVLQTHDAEQSELTLAALKQARKRVEVGKASTLPPSRSRKFEADEDLESAGDFAKVVGVATEDPSTDPPPVAATNDEDSESESSTTGRLLDAKRRARRSRP